MSHAVTSGLCLTVMLFVKNKTAQNHAVRHKTDTCSDVAAKHAVGHISTGCGKQCAGWHIAFILASSMYCFDMAFRGLLSEQ